MVNNRFGEYLRQRRRDAGLTRKQLAEQANVSASLIEKIELGTRSTTAHTMLALLDRLDVPPLYRRHILGTTLPSVYDAAEHAKPSSADLADLASLPHPAGFYRMPTYGIVAVNAAYRRAFPGAEAGVNFVEWMFLDPNARTVFVEWRSEAHRIVRSLRLLTLTSTFDDDLARIIENCSGAMEWNEIWNDILQPEPAREEYLDLRDTSTALVRRMGIRLYNPEFPSRPWWLLRLVPLQE
ncbi:helix-turn-helix domain-containing protein [Nocardia huaxiensis]|uniref:Helix-turn-helix domain-containing protein n=1 Tax=Nocardia huaxiensis TaxID=2755382 RepID=A0A7D6ZAD4_9NOCA|nr:helix-turn-helix domain-containing protein [Nocardia huaxiensis]QLY30848.1 helix-turn-helix domain-containing protein [Nocardia huaxiensis]UFS94352.1 helix-turn-helix transcriptional regulator [Nocardia huaxiensis]